MSRAHWALLIALGLFALLALAAPMLPSGDMGPGMMQGYAWPNAFGPWGWHFGTGWPFTLAFGLRAVTALAFWAIIVLGIVLVARWTNESGSRKRH